MLPRDVAVGPDGGLYIAEFSKNAVRKVGPDGIITTIAQVSQPTAVAVAADGSVFIAEMGNHRVRKVAPDRTITTVAGTGQRGYGGDGGPATEALFDFSYYPPGVAVSPQGDLYIADSGNGRVRRVGPDGIITTIAEKYCPHGLAVGPDGSIYFCVDDSAGCFVVWKVTPDGLISRIAGREDGWWKPLGDGGPARNASLCAEGVAVGPDGSIYIADGHNHHIRWVNPDGIINSLAGIGDHWTTLKEGYSGDRGTGGCRPGQ